MAETLKILGQSPLAPAVLTPVYTVPANTQASISSIIICNRGNTPDTFRISVAPGAAADAPSQQLYFDVPIPGNDTFVVTTGITLGPGDAIRVRGESGNLTASVWGAELT